MWNKRFHCAGFIVLSVALLSGLAHANLIKNGSFEDPATAPGQSRGTELGTLWFAGGTGWGDEDVDGWNRTTRIWHVTDGGAGLMPDGSYAEVLDASFEHNGVDVLSQSGLKLTAGMPYELSFYTWGESGNPRIDVDLTGAANISLLDDYETDWTDGIAEHVAVRFVPTVTGEYTIEFRGDRYEGANVHYHVWIDDVQLVVKLPIADTPSPGNENEDVPHEVTLSWRPGGPSIVKHDVYFGATFEDVNSASVAEPKAVLASAGQDANTLDVGALDFGQTYYWRVDEVNSAPDNTRFKGEVWSFTTEPFSIMIPVDVDRVTASSFAAPNPPGMMVNGSGLTGTTHSTESEDMWLSNPGDPSPWLMVEFDQVQKLDHLLVWNSNNNSESFIGWGIKDVTIETSMDGAEWASLAEPVQVNRAP
ncbi:MAG: hypothetical protein K9N55_00435, partial [Phycisphaerae bacterium]|nr:hypothetical protein [Phycisphaerae bacterium]